jgi:hypothetical protein
MASAEEAQTTFGGNHADETEGGRSQRIDIELPAWI